MNTHNPPPACISQSVSPLPHFPPSSVSGGAPIEPVIPTAMKYRDYIREHYPDVKLICPLTHQSITDDRQFAKACMGFPVVIGGHGMSSPGVVMGHLELVVMVW